jgi:hypothetical protein
MINSPEFQIRASRTRNTPRAAIRWQYGESLLQYLNRINLFGCSWYFQFSNVEFLKVLKQMRRVCIDRSDPEYVCVCV